MPTDKITKEHLTVYLEKTETALDKLRIQIPERSFMRKAAEDFHNMAAAYFKDAEHFFEKGEYINSFACVNYAHGWLDCGARLGFFDVGEDDSLFTLYE